MRLLLDTNILLDTLLSRPGARVSAKVIASCADRHAGLLAWHALATIHYLVLRVMSAKEARACVQGLLEWVEIARTGHPEALRALEFEMTDFEDALQAAAAEACGADFIITRNDRDFAHSPVKALTPEEFLRRFPSR